MSHCSLIFAFICLLFHLIAKAHEIKSNHNHGNSSLSNILTTQNVSALYLPELETIFRGIGFINCSTVQSNDCNKCLTAEQLMKAHSLNLSAEINETAFNKLAPGILYHLLPSPSNSSNCSEVTRKSTFTAKDVFESIGMKYNKSSVDGDVLDRVLEDINATKLSENLIKKPCFSAADVLIGLDVVDKYDHDEADLQRQLSHEQFKSACVLFIEHIVLQFCIKESHQHMHHDKDELPSKMYFINKIFEKYGANGIMSKEKFENFYKEVGIFQDDHEEEEDDHAHDHKRRRRDLRDYMQQLLNRRSRRSSYIGNSSEDKFDKCYSAEQVMDIFDVKKSEGISTDKFQEVCPSIVMQLESKKCIKNGDKVTVVEHTDHDKLKVWGYGILAVTIISLLSLIGASAIPFMGTSFYDNTMTFFVALAVGTLCGDALIHLFPHSLGIHAHDSHTESDGESHAQELAIIWKSMSVVAAIYAFYIFEYTMTFFTNCSGSVSHTHGHSHGQGLTIIQNPSVGHFEDEHAPSKSISSIPDDKIIEKELSSSSSSMKAFGLMIIIGDVMHNIVDGVAIGVAFSEMEVNGLSGGISTSIAIFCHELPHELGDFAVLVASGMSVKKALLLNFLSACCCFIGLFIGIGLGETENIRLWAFSVTAGMFIYVSLVTVLPEMLRNKDIKKSPLKVFILQNLGLLSGFVIMSLLAVYEEDIIF